MSYFNKISKMVGKSSIKTAIKNISDTAEYIINKTSLKP